METKNYTITAKEARATADSTPKFLKRILKEINRMSEDGYTVLRWSAQDISEQLINSTKDALEELGYNVSIETYTNEISDVEVTECPGCLIISW